MSEFGERGVCVVYSVSRCCCCERKCVCVCKEIERERKKEIERDREGGLLGFSVLLL